MKTIVWDFDGTLARREGGWSAACVEAIRDHDPGASVAVEDIRPFLGEGFPWHEPEEPHTEITTADEWWAQLEPVLATAIVQQGIDADAVDRIVSDIRRRYLRHGWSIYDDTTPVLARLSQEGWTNLVLSNHVPELPSIIDRLGLVDHIDDVFTSATIGFEKPHPSAFEPVLARIDDREDAWMVGDSYEADVAGAEAVGLSAILVRGEHEAATRQCAGLAGVVDLVSGAP